MPRGFPLQDEGPGMKQMFHDLAIEQEEAKAAKAASFHDAATTEEIAKRMQQSFDACGDRWFKAAADRLRSVRDAALEEAAVMLKASYPDNANTNAFCAAIRSLKSAVR